MLAIRMQRTGRKGHAMFRVVVQDARRTPTSGKIVARLGSYDPHAKTVALDKEKAGFYLEHGAQPSPRVAALLKKEGVKLPDWVKLADKREGSVRNPDKRRSTRPDEPAEEKPEATEAPTKTANSTETPAEPVVEAEQSSSDTAANNEEKADSPAAEVPSSKPEIEAPTKPEPISSEPNEKSKADEPAESPEADKKDKSEEKTTSASN